MPMHAPASAAWQAPIAEADAITDDAPPPDDARGLVHVHVHPPGGTREAESAQSHPKCNAILSVTREAERSPSHASSCAPDAAAAAQVAAAAAPARAPADAHADAHAPDRGAAQMGMPAGPEVAGPEVGPVVD